MSIKPETLVFSADPAKRRRHVIFLWAGFFIVLATTFFQSYFLPGHNMIFLIPLFIWQWTLLFLGIDSPFRRQEEVIITPVSLKGASLQRAGRAYLMLEDLMIEPSMMQRNPPKWLQWLAPARTWIAINHPKTPYGFKMDISLLSSEDQQTVLTILQQRFREEMSPEQ
ncbi:hypothetical protein ACFOSD_11510 [Salinispirillum marinum]|uniref:DUF2244 domain-containing protein n=2 Tax=Saccharospirillaceae TaxID=255527 RepID=A0ABV8BIV7_9GAMM